MSPLELGPAFSQSEPSGDRWVFVAPRAGRRQDGEGEARSAPPGLAADDGACQVIFDGALYDKAELTRTLDGAKRGSTDARLVLAAYRRWGERVVEHLNGTFALIIWDRECDLLLCARDRLGIYPLFWSAGSNGVLISLSFDLLANDPRVSKDLNRAALADHLCLRWADKEETLVRAIRRVPPGHLVKIKNGHHSVARYWDPTPDGSQDWVTEDELDQFDDLFTRAIDRCLALGPAGIYLSGGLDSVSVAAVARDRSRSKGMPSPWGLSLAFPDPECAEEHVQRAVASRLGLSQVMVGLHESVAPRGLIRSALDLARGWPAPLLNYWLPAYHHIGRAGKKNGCNVILSGTGGDEWLCVSPFYAANLMRRGDLAGLARLFLNLQRSNPFPPVQTLRNVLWLFGLRPLVSAGAASALSVVAPRALRRHRMQSIDGQTPRWVAPDASLRREIDERAYRSRPQPTSDFYGREVVESLDHPLVGIEVEEAYESGRRIGAVLRQPYWDPDLIGFLARTPPELLNRGGRSKGPVRDMVARRFPGLGFERHKKVAATRFAASTLMQEVPAVWRESGGAPGLTKLGIIDGNLLEEEVEWTFSENRTRDVHRLWYIMSLEAWVQGRGLS
jgi:asparagine synthase (glutamine-hydrolysing)